ncbi:MAG: penicillin-binding protein 2 [candidate division NC10 bacterium]|nr:penicillin-binding protein 2 [candidate division NC10 bacterium]
MAWADATFRPYSQLQRRMSLFQVLAMIAFLILTLRLWHLQILEGSRYEALSKSNRLRLRIEEGCRGLIVDRNGEVLAKNRASFDVFVTPGDVSDLNAICQVLSQFLKIDPEELTAQLEKGRERAQEPILVKRDIDEAAMVAIQERKHELGGVTLRVRPLRFYPRGDFATHLLGYVSEIHPAQLLREENRDFRSGERIGQGGVEGAYDGMLRGIEGGQQVEVDASGHETRALGRIEPKSGYTTVLTLDAHIQELAEEALEGKKGVGVVMNPLNGEILALVSKPSYDPNLFISGLSPQQWDSLVKDPYHPLQNRALQSAYPPGSLFKLITAIAALNKGVISPETRFRCEGKFTLGAFDYACWKKEGHGIVDLKQAIAHSCNVYFYNTALRVGMEEMAKTAREFGMGEPLGLRLCEEAQGLVPTPEWKKEVKGERWYLGNTIQAGIGQGMMSATPLQILQMTSAIANGGHLFRPMILKEIRTPEGEVVETYGPDLIRKIPLSADVLSAVRRGMWATVNENGTGALAKVEGFDVCGKTATAQVASRPREGAIRRAPTLVDHAWFACFAPMDNPQIAMVVLVEHGGFGSVAAAQVARHILEGIFSPEGKREGDLQKASALSTIPPERKNSRTHVR